LVTMTAAMVTMTAALLVTLCRCKEDGDSIP
jgi:hypothetical protein